MCLWHTLCCAGKVLLFFYSLDVETGKKPAEGVRLLTLPGKFGMRRVALMSVGPMAVLLWHEYCNHLSNPAPAAARSQQRAAHLMAELMMLGHDTAPRSRTPP